MRLNKYIAQAGICSRRKADELTEQGKVKINGAVMNHPGYDVKDGDVVVVDGRQIGGASMGGRTAERKVYYALNKPKGYITSVSDDRDRPIVTELLVDVEERIFPVGRLDYNTSGLLILTNDGDFAYKLSHPKHELPKTYRARVSGVITPEKKRSLEKGVDIGGFVTSPASVHVLKQGNGSAVVEITIHEGKNRQVRKMFAAVGSKVLDLERVAIGDLKLGHLLVGHYRRLTRQEIDSLLSPEQ